jgi:hypothetical protein
VVVLPGKGVEPLRGNRVELPAVVRGPGRTVPDRPVGDDGGDALDDEEQQQPDGDARTDRDT